jgi:ferrous iron transport protein A
LKLSELKKEQQATVEKVNATGELKQRLASFGLLKGANIKIVDCSLTKSTIEVMVDTTLLALRKSEADQIEVKIDGL